MIEAGTLPLAGLAADLGLAEPLEAARLKLLAALPPAVGAGAAQVSRRVHIDAVD